MNKTIYTFCRKKDGIIKKNYIPICEYILEASLQEHTILVGRSEKIIDLYECYTTPFKSFYAKEKENYKKKIKEICSNFNVTTKEWYSCMDMNVELHGDNVEIMFKELRKILGRD